MEASRQSPCITLPSMSRTGRGELQRDIAYFTFVETGDDAREYELLDVSHLCHNEQCIARGHLTPETRRENLARWNCQSFCNVCSPGNQQIDPGYYRRLRLRCPHVPPCITRDL